MSIRNGVDWSANASSTSHCWFPLIDNELSTTHSCESIQCGTCALIIHSQDFNDAIPPCRLSLIDTKDNSLKHDEHFWSRASLLSTPCAHCQRTPANNNIFSSEYLTSMINTMSESFNVKMSYGPSNGLVCLWCERSYHQSCWEQLTDDEKKMECDYGIFRDIIVRPQWLSRSMESSVGFRATVSLPTDNTNFPFTPVLAFINKRSGGQIGERIYRILIQKLNPRQVFVLENNETINHALEIYSLLPNLRICVFGGDGTVGWILDRLAEAYSSGDNPPVSICPLGTGNDLSRVLSWGEQYDPKQLFQTLLQIPHAETVSLDRWQVKIEEIDALTLQNRETGFSMSRIFPILFNDPKFARETNRVRYENYQKLPNTRFINYMSFGLDAAVALEFHDHRTRDPSKFSSPMKNKLMYFNETGKYLNDFARANNWDLSSYIRLTCDGQDLTGTLENCHTLIILNIPGYAAGTNPWGNSSENSINLLELLSSNRTCFDRQDFGDRKIEVVGLSTTHMAAIHVGLAGNRIAQCRELRLELSSPMTVQMDGEPFYLSASIAINISHAGQVLLSQNKTK